MWLVATIMGSSALDLSTTEYRGHTEIHSVKHRLWEAQGKQPGAFNK